MAMMESKAEGSIAVITMNRPENRNAISVALFVEEGLKAIFEKHASRIC